MYQENDYILRLIHEIIRMLFKLVIGIDIDRTEAYLPQDPEAELRLKRLLLMVDDGNVNEAENKLLDELDADNRSDFALALLFYEYLSKKGADFLESCNFSEKEVFDGVRYVVNLYGCTSMVEAFTEELDR